MLIFPMSVGSERCFVWKVSVNCGGWKVAVSVWQIIVLRLSGLGWADYGWVTRFIKSLNKFQGLIA